MTCPFLKEVQVKYCRTASVRKMILAVACGTEEKCASGEHRHCKVFQAQPEAAGDGPCPFLHESLMQYCAAASVPKLVPYSESVLSRCGNDSFRYCELYLSMAQPRVASDDVDGLPMPRRLLYARNHMWLDVSAGDTCHVGIDSFLSRVLGQVERLTFVPVKGRTRPAAVLTVAGTDHGVIFPNAFEVTGCNLYLRANPARLATDPYTAGWLFEGRPTEETMQSLMEGTEARRWMEQEQRRMNEFLQAEEAAQSGTMADGGTFAEGLVHRLSRERTLVMFHEFFSPLASGESF